ncbi:hypothetical protein [Microbacterium rhizophilus]|uniref:hypothetical protein n=1 Tax=Microbacterium rhizophilus TaxID=3138934 RepID=UPI0031E57939
MIKNWAHSLAPLLSITSQGIGVAQLALLLWRIGPNQHTDAYLYLFNMGMLPTQIVIVGVVFPMLLNRDRISKRQATVVRHSVPLLACIFVVGACAWLWMNERLDTAMIPLVLASIANAFVQSKLWFRAVAAEAGGDPNWISGIAIPANSLAVVALLLPLQKADLILAMIVALVLGNGVLLATMWKHRIGDRTLDELPHARTPGSRAEGWFLTKAGVSYGGLAIIQSMAVILPPAMLTLLSVAAKIVASLVATFVNAIMPRIVHQASTSLEPSMRFLSWLYAGAVAAAAALIAAAWWLRPDLISLAMCVGLWLAGSASNAVGQRAAYRFLPANVSRITILVVPLITVLTVISATVETFQLITLICAYAAVDAITGAVLLVRMRQRRNASIALTVIVLLGVMWTWSLIVGG